MKRRIIHIDEERCNGCGACAAACHEGAIEKTVGFIEGLNIREISERVMQELFKALAMHFEFSLNGIMEAEK